MESFKRAGNVFLAKYIRSSSSKLVKYLDVLRLERDGVTRIHTHSGHVQVIVAVLWSMLSADTLF